MNDVVKKWTGELNLGEKIEINAVFEKLCQAFNSSPFFQHNAMQMRVVDGQIQAYIQMQPHLIGNLQYQILHGGSTATLLDSVGGIIAMAELYKKATKETFEQVSLQAARLATLDIRVDYLKPGRGEYFIATAEALRMGRKGCTMRMNMVNDQHELIATAIASYAY
ncbi:thioesterase family protein [Acinetobacter sp. B51(2017)]|uniref:thioesterase family protein n=1 Tax=Acinetobacter sp. B51(2017) TaxID=2060938 RepID=UPI000F08E160|nr:thioesterase family protein [Acinetobacter sp. B51(2017)]